MLGQLLVLAVLAGLGVALLAGGVVAFLWSFERRRDAASDHLEVDGFPDPVGLTVAEARQLLDRRAHQLLDLDGPDFVDRYLAGQLDRELPDVAEVARLVPYCGLDREPLDPVTSPRLTRLD